MPTRLPNGLLIYNMTPHPLHFQTDAGIVTAPSDGRVDAVPITKEVEGNKRYTLNNVRFVADKQTLEELRKIKEAEPDALIVGSMIAAKAYPSLVVYSVPVLRSRGQTRLLVRSDRFSTFRKAIQVNG